MAGTVSSLNIMESVPCIDRDLLPDELLDLRQQPDVLGGTKGNGASFGPGTGRAANAVDISVRGFRNVIVDDQGN